MKKLIKRLYSNTFNVLHLTPFPVSPKGEMLKMSPSPVGESLPRFGWAGKGVIK